MKWLRFVFVTSVALMLAACGGAGPGGGSGPTGPITETITSQGGSIRAVTKEGAVVTLAFPPGATAEPLDVTVTPHAPETAGWLRLELSPAGTQFRERILITATAPPGVSVDRSSTFYFGTAADRGLLPTQHDASGRTLTTSTLLLGYAETVETEGLHSLNGGSSFLNVAQIECQIALDSLSTRLDYVRNFPFSSSQSASQLIQEIEAMQEICSGDATAVDAQMAQVKQAACDGYRDATTDAAVLASDSSEGLLELVGEVLNWEGVKQLAGAECGEDYTEVIGTEFDEFIDKFVERVDSSDFPSEYNAIWNELRSAAGLLGHTQSLGLEPGHDKVRQQLLPPLLDKLREAAYQECRDNDDQVYLADILWSGAVLSHPLPASLFAPPAGSGLGAQAAVADWANFTEDDLLADIQYCASAMTLEVWTVLPRKVDDLTRELQGGDTPGGQVASAETRSPVVGGLVLDGEIRAFRCAGGQLGSGELVIKLNYVEVDRLQHSGGDFLANRVDLDLEEILQKAGIDPELKNTFAFGIYREGEACGSWYGGESFKLFTVDIEFDPKPKLLSVSVSPASLQADQDQQQTFSLSYEDPGENLLTVTDAFKLLPDGGSGSFTATIGVDTAILSNFQAPSGTGTYQVVGYVGCSEKGNATLRDTFTLMDEFDQESEEAFADTSVSYGGCP